jgi:hypothetical protein
LRIVSRTKAAPRNMERSLERLLPLQLESELLVEVKRGTLVIFVSLDDLDFQNFTDGIGASLFTSSVEERLGCV